MVEKVLEYREAGLALKAQAILFRASHHSGPLEVELTRRNIPFVKFGGLKFLEADHIRMCWRSCVGPRTRAIESQGSASCSSCLGSDR